MYARLFFLTLFLSFDRSLTPFASISFHHILGQVQLHVQTAHKKDVCLYVCEFAVLRAL